MKVNINEKDIIGAAQKGNEAFVDLFSDRILASVGGELTADTMQQLTPDQITLLAYQTLKREVMEGGFIQLIYNGYGPFIFLNPFAKAMRLWGAREFSKLVYDGRRLYEEYGEQLTRECTDEEFMALFEQMPDFENFDDTFVENEENWTEKVACYVDEHIQNFVVIED